MYPTGAAPNGSHCISVPYQIGMQMLLNAMIFYLMLGYVNPRLHLWVRYHSHVNLGNMLITVGFLCTGLLSACLSLAGSRYSHTFPLHLGTSAKLLYYSEVSSMSGGMIICSLCRSTNSFLNGSCSTYSIHLGGTWYDLALSLICKENFPLE